MRGAPFYLKVASIWLRVLMRTVFLDMVGPRWLLSKYAFGPLRLRRSGGRKRRFWLRRR